MDIGRWLKLKWNELKLISGLCPNLKMTHDCHKMPSNGFSISGPKQNVGPHLAPVSDFDPVRDLFKNYHRKQNQG